MRQHLDPDVGGQSPTEDDLLLLGEWIRDHYGYDFLAYQQTPLKKSVAALLGRLDVQNVAELLQRLTSDPTLFPSVLAGLTITTSSMFRNPLVFGAIARDVFPYLRTFSRVKIWHGGCARGEEVYSLAILLKEHQLLDRTRIYATDINPEALAAAREGIYPIRRLKSFAENYSAAGGTGSLSDHCEVKYGHAKFSSELSSRILFSKHDLMSDTSFGEMQLILCRNVLIYFNQPLQERAIRLLRDSLCPGGFLCLGPSEILVSTAARYGLSTFSKREAIFRALGACATTGS